MKHSARALPFQGSRLKGILMRITLPFFLLFFSLSGGSAQTKLQYSPAPIDNPLKGFVPYVDADSWDRFPHSMEFHYFGLKDLMKGYQNFDWSPIEEKLGITEPRGVQLIFRVMMEYPSGPNHVPEFLIKDGVKVTKWKTPDGFVHTPDYENPKLGKAMASFISELGKRYDGDPRIGFVTAGLLGHWGEWHNYPRSDEFWASKTTQRLVLNAFEASFKRTPVLLRYPAKPGHYDQAENVARPFGYHDDSFNWATLDTGKPADSWFFIPLLKEASAMEKWRTQPIGGELRPELWKTSFTDNEHPKAQGFERCVRETHVTWLMDSGLFEKRFPLPPKRRERAIHEGRRMGYEFYVSQWEKKGEAISITVENRGVAPFYHDWPAELFAGSQKVSEFDLRKILPGQTKIWKTTTKLNGPFQLRVRNPMSGGKPLQFSNQEQDGEWLKLLNPTEE